jgi:hypothetical protein
MPGTLNLFGATRDPWDGGNAAAVGELSVKTVRPNTTDPIPTRTTPPSMGTIMVRFLALLVVAVGLLALVWSR